MAFVLRLLGSTVMLLMEYEYVSMDNTDNILSYSRVAVGSFAILCVSIYFRCYDHCYYSCYMLVKNG